MSLASRILASSRLIASDVSSLASSLLVARPTSIPSVREVLIKSARQGNGNAVAASFLRVDREFGLVRYHGIGGYVTAKGGMRALLLPESSGGSFDMTRFLFGPPSGKGRNDSDNQTGGGTITENSATDSSTKSSTSPKKARVAFMITSKQRQQLTVNLGYQPSDIRSLRPLEALLILEHGIQPGNEEEVKRLVAENEALGRFEAERAEKEMKDAAAATMEESMKVSGDEVQENELPHQRQQVDKEIGETTIDSPSETKSTLALAAGCGEDPNQSRSEKPEISARNEQSQLSKAINDATSSEAQESEDANSDDNIWYEVIEVRSPRSSNNEATMNDGVSISDDTVVVALYRTIEEAQDCLEWKEGKSQGQAYEIRQRQQLPGE